MSDCIISLCDKSGNMLKPWAAAGYECYAVDVQHSIRRERVEGNIHYVWGDIRSWFPPARPHILFAFTPCTDLCGSGARDWAQKHWPMLRDGIDLFHAAYMAAQWAKCPYMLENSVGRIPSWYTGHQHTFHPWQYGADYQKLTCIWAGGGFVMPEPTVVVKPDTCSQKIWKMPPTRNRADLRSETSMYFARAVFEANRRLVKAQT